MLQPGNRRLLLDALRPPAGYRLDRAVGTSYCVDLVALLTAPLAFTFFDWEDEDGRPTANPLALLEAVRRNADRIHLFCQAGRLKVPRSGQTLLAYLEGSVFEVQAPQEGGVFHLKVWLLRFTAADQSVCYRLLCLSRNLTFDRSWDTALMLDGVLTSRRQAIAANHPLGDFIEALPRMALHPVPRDVAAGIRQMQEEVRRVRFEPPENFDEVAFHLLGLQRKARWPFPNSRWPCVVVSPFVSESTAHELAAGRSRAVLISSPTELVKLSSDTLREFAEVYCLAEAADTDTASDEDEPAAVRDEETLTGLHAKLYVMDDGWNASVWTGSANATHSAFHGNVEFLVELRGKKSRVGVESLLGDGDTNRGSATLRDLLQPFSSAQVQIEIDPVAVALERKLEEARSLLAAARLRARVTLNPDGSTYAVELVPGMQPFALPSGCSLRCWPISLRQDAALSLEASNGRSPLARFEMLSFAALTGFFAFELTARDQGQDAQARFALNLPLDGAPEDREEGLLRVLLKDREQVMRLLWLLLANDDLSASDLAAALGADVRAGTWRGAEGSRFPLLEVLLRALDRDPARLDDAARLIADLRRTPEGRDLLPEDLDAIWEPIWEVSQEQLRRRTGIAGSEP